MAANIIFRIFFAYTKIQFNNFYTKKRLNFVEPQQFINHLTLLTICCAINWFLDFNDITNKYTYMYVIYLVYSYNVWLSPDKH